MDKVRAMSVFVKVAETGSFVETSRHLRLSPPTVTRAIALLEEMIGARLLVRTTRHVTLTEAGTRYLADCRRILVDMEEAAQRAAGLHGDPAGTLSVTAPVLFGRIHVLPVLLAFMDRYPRVTVQAEFSDRWVDLVEAGIDAAVRIGNLPDSSLAARRVGWVRQVVVASPDYLARAGAPLTPDDLAQHGVIAASSVARTTQWRFGPEGKQAVTVKPRLYCNTNEAVIEAAARGYGITRVFSYQAAEAIGNGRLQTVLDPFAPEPVPVQLIHPQPKGVPNRVRAFLDLAGEMLSLNPALQQEPPPRR